jgi:hypothetical protein
MMSLTEIEKANVNLDIAREALNQASARLGDILDTKKAFEQKAFTLFSGYLTAALALFGVGGAIYKDHGVTNLVLMFWLTGLLLVAGAVCFVWALKDDGYGALASDPSMWLRPGTIDGGATVLPRMLAYVTWHHQDRITASLQANKRKATLIARGIYFGIAAPVVLLGLFVCLR